MSSNQECNERFHILDSFGNPVCPSNPGGHWAYHSVADNTAYIAQGWRTTIGSAALNHPDSSFDEIPAPEGNQYLGLQTGSTRPVTEVTSGPIAVEPGRSYSLVFQHTKRHQAHAEYFFANQLEVAMRGVTLHPPSSPPPPSPPPPSPEAGVDSGGAGFARRSLTSTSNPHPVLELLTVPANEQPASSWWTKSVGFTAEHEHVEFIFRARDDFTLPWQCGNHQNEQHAQYVMKTGGTCESSGQTQVTTVEECEHAVALWGTAFTAQDPGWYAAGDYPTGCVWENLNSGYLWFNGGSAMECTEQKRCICVSSWGRDATTWVDNVQLCDRPAARPDLTISSRAPALHRPPVRKLRQGPTTDPPTTLH